MDLLLINPPLTRLFPPVSIALIKSSVESVGFSCKILDWNVDLWKKMNDKSQVEIDRKDWDNNIVNLYHEEEIQSLWEREVKEISRSWMNEIQNINPTWVGFSINCVRSMLPFVIKFCQLIREKFPSIKIVIGGAATAIYYECNEFLIKEKLADAYITGEGEIATIELLKGNTSYPGINNLNSLQIENLNNLPFADYSDLNITSYSDNRFNIVTTRGCTRRCNFCCNSYPKYRYRDSINVVNEMVELYNKYGAITFLLGDSTSNGNPKQFLEFIKSIIQYKKNGLLPEKMNWTCPFNCVSEKIIGEETYQCLKESGCIALGVGIESGSEKIRFDMNKKIKDEDVDFLFNQCRKYKIGLSLCFMVGYYTETEEDFTKNIDLLNKYSSFNEDIEIIISTLQSFGIQKGSYIYNNWMEIGISFKSYNKWSYKDNTPEVRLDRLIRFKEHALKMGYGIRIAKEKLLKRDI